MLTRWKTGALKNFSQLFENETFKAKQAQKDYENKIDELYKQIGRLTTENQWMKKNLVSSFSRNERISMINFDRRELPVSVQAGLLGINITSLYYKSSLTGEHDLFIKREIDKIYTTHPEFGYRRITVWLKKYNNMTINKKAVLRHMREMGIQAIYPRKNTSKTEQGHIIYPYLLKGLVINRPNQVWSIDITYVPIHKSWLYLVAIIDWYSRFVVSWEIDDNLEIHFVLNACKNALKQACPEIMNGDQGSHFTSSKYTSLFIEAGSRISMDHRGRAYDNIFIERLWRSLKYENIYLQDYQNPREARIGIRSYLKYYNYERPHQSLKYNTPAEIYFKS